MRVGVSGALRRKGETFLCRMAEATPITGRSEGASEGTRIEAKDREGVAGREGALGAVGRQEGGAEVSSGFGPRFSFKEHAMPNA